MSCCCQDLADLAVIPMGGDGLDERVFTTVKRLMDHGKGAWWLYLSRCEACGQHWLVAQEERIFDDYFLRRLAEDEAQSVISEHQWPDEFITYEGVLRIGQKLSSPCRFIDPLSPSLVWTAKDLRQERPDITAEEIAWLVGVTELEAFRLLSA